MSDDIQRSTDEIDNRIEEVKARLGSTQRYLDNTTKSYKRVRQMRGADAHRKAWEFEALMKRYQEALQSIEHELAELTQERERLNGG